MAFGTSGTRRHAVGRVLEPRRGGGSRRQHRSAAAFTLAEVLVAISIFGITALGVQGLYLGLVRTTNMNAHYAAATELAQAELEELRGTRYVEVDSRSSAATVGGIVYTIASVVSEGVPAAEMKHIQTTVSWTDAGGVSEQFSMETIYAEIRS
jgi:prepilin-type N-terminal cleavage/methylation domain-containing protein